MRVSPVGLYFNSYSSKSNFNKNVTVLKNNQSNQDSKYNYASVLSFMPNVTFTSRKPFLLNIEKYLTAFDELICPYSGKPMIPRPIFEQVLTTEALEKKQGKRVSASEAIEVLSGFEGNMHEVELKVFQRLKEDSGRHPKKTLAELLEMLKPQSERELDKNQFKIFRTIDYLSEGLPERLKGDVAILTGKAQRLVEKKDPQAPFSRSKFVSDIAGLEKYFANKELFRRVHKASLELLNPQNNVLAFVVNNSGKSSTEVGRKLLEPAVMTFEHIVPHKDHGTKEYSNGLLVSAGFNFERGEMSFTDWLEKHPEIPGYCQKYINGIIALIKRENLTQYEQYPAAVAETLKRESNGAIVLDLNDEEAQRVSKPLFSFLDGVRVRIFVEV